jgi:hypothetical protein
MPSKSPAQHRLMEAAAHTKGGFGGVPQKVGKEFAKKDKAERLKIIDDVTTKPQRMEIVDKVLSAKKMKEGGLYANINAKRERISEGSGEKMRRVGSKGAPTAKAFKQSAKKARMKDGGKMMKSCW